jgi:hypothetical protein
MSLLLHAIQKRYQPQTEHEQNEQDGKGCNICHWLISTGNLNAPSVYADFHKDRDKNLNEVIKKASKPYHVSRLDLFLMTCRGILSQS